MMSAGCKAAYGLQIIFAVVSHTLFLNLFAMTSGSFPTVIFVQADTPTESKNKYFMAVYIHNEYITFFLNDLDTKVLVATGMISRNPTFKALKDIEVLDLKNPDMKCQNLAPFPDGLIGATGAFVNNSIAVVCGGAKGTVFWSWRDVEDRRCIDEVGIFHIWDSWSPDKIVHCLAANPFI